MAFHDVLFPAALSFGSSGGPERRTEIVTLASGFEERNALWAHSRRRYDAGIGLRTLDDLHEVIAFFEARLGRLHAFRWKDWTDCKSCPPSASVSPCDQALGTGDGETAEFRLSRAYVSGGKTYRRPIAKPAQGTVRIGSGGAELPTAAYSIDHATGAVTFGAPPPAGAILTAGFEFHVPARFDTDRIEVSLAAFEAGEIPSIPVVEVRT